MKKIAFFAFKGSAICFVHVLLNAIDLVEKGHQATIIMEGGRLSGAPLDGTVFKRRLHHYYNVSANRLKSLQKADYPVFCRVFY